MNLSILLACLVLHPDSIEEAGVYVDDITPGSVETMWLHPDGTFATKVTFQGPTFIRDWRDTGAWIADKDSIKLKGLHEHKRKFMKKYGGLAEIFVVNTPLDLTRLDYNFRWGQRLYLYGFFKKKLANAHDQLPKPMPPGIFFDRGSISTDFYNEFKIPHLLWSQHNVEIRFIEYGWPSYHRCVVLTYDSQWHAKCYLDRDLPGDTLRVIDLGTEINLDSFYTSLIRQHFFTMPDFSEEYAIKRTYSKGKVVDESDFSVADGTSYTVEFKFGDQYRSYYYSNPDAYLKFNPKLQVMKDMLAIVELFEVFGR